MSLPNMTKMHMNGYDVISVKNGPWVVCTDHDRLGAFATQEEAMAFAASLPGRKVQGKRHKVA